ncbi:auxin-induced protein 15A-like [Zea mays]|uniref:SAUR-like auxin-responsive protein family n=1 Tax=Zea mays TaxID=4577 RepID=A0A804UFG1_MAIZE|nr:auxin-induced protein 15A-like [Zea mays]|eukprot:XP_008657285.1 auxin-induced protein 15A-like [Zea mays]
MAPPDPEDISREEKRTKASKLQEQGEGEEEEAMRLPSDVSHGHFAVYVGEWWRRFVVHIALLDRPEFRSLLRRAEEEFGFTGAGGALVLPYEEVAFRSLTSALACAR